MGFQFIAKIKLVQKEQENKPHFSQSSFCDTATSTNGYDHGVHKNTFGDIFLKVLYKTIR